MITLLDEAEPLLAAYEVAALFRVDRKLPGRWVKAGLINAIRTPGGHYRFRASDVYAALERDAESKTPVPAVSEGCTPGPD